MTSIPTFTMECYFKKGCSARAYSTFKIILYLYLRSVIHHASTPITYIQDNNVNLYNHVQYNYW